jgi:hypothetical protein
MRMLQPGAYNGQIAPDAENGTAGSTSSVLAVDFALRYGSEAMTNSVKGARHDPGKLAHARHRLESAAAVALPPITQELSLADGVPGLGYGDVPAAARPTL